MDPPVTALVLSRRSRIEPSQLSTNACARFFTRRVVESLGNGFSYGRLEKHMTKRPKNHPQRQQRREDVKVEKLLKRIEVTDVLEKAIREAGQASSGN